MPRQKTSTRRREIRPLGVAERLPLDAPPTRYTYNGTGRVDASKTYTVKGVAHTFDGSCHDDCQDVR